MHPLRPFIQKYYGKVMNNYIRKELNKRFDEIKDIKVGNEAIGRAKSVKSVITLAIESYIDEIGYKTQKLELDEHFTRYAIYQIRLFLFAGNDTTSSTIVYVFHLLSKHPD